MADFMKLYKSWGSRRGLKTLLDKNVSANEWVVEYAGGSLGGEKMHTYGRALLVNGKVYFPEATATEKEWAQGGARLKACVDSFELMPPPGPAQPAASATAATVTKAEFPQAGFRIAPLDDAATPSTYHTIIGTTFRPAIVQVFTVTLGVETYTKTMAEYAAEVKKGPNSPEYKYLLQLPLGKIISEKFPDSNSWVAETDFGPDYKHYVRFVLANGRMFSMSALLPSDEKKWPGLAARMKECVDSLEAMETPKAAPAK